MTDFSQQIANFVNYGTYNYKLDEVGNEVLNPSSSVFQQVYFSLPLGNYVYSNSKILSFYDSQFTEFIPSISTPIVESSSFSQEVIDKIDAITNENKQLQGQLDSLIKVSEMNSSSADIQAAKSIIVGLRIQLGEGTTTSDFQTVFPYFPVPIESQNAPST